MTKWVITLALVLSWTTACKETKYEDTPDTVKAMQQLRESVTEKDGYIKKLEERIYELENADTSADSGEIVVNITGDTLTITKGKDKGPSVKNNGPAAADEDLYKSFVTQVQRSRGSMQRCYTNALKKDSGLQVRSVTLKIQVKFKASGSVAKSTFKPTISGSFDKCMTTIAQRWKLTGTREALTFQQPITLSPQ